MTKLAGISALVVLCSISAHAAVEADSKPEDWPADAASHVVKIDRTITKEDDAKWITAAEAIAADVTAVEAAVIKEDANAVVQEKQWWYKQEDTVKIPYALTGDAVTFYSELVTGYGKQAVKSFMKPSSQFSYNAAVARDDKFIVDDKTFQNVIVVTLRMDFSYDSDRGISFSKQRVVVFDHDGKILHVSGDGPTEARIKTI